MQKSRVLQCKPGAGAKLPTFPINLLPFNAVIDLNTWCIASVTRMVRFKVKPKRGESPSPFVCCAGCSACDESKTLTRFPLLVDRDRPAPLPPRAHLAPILFRNQRRPPRQRRVRQCRPVLAYLYGR